MAEGKKGPIRLIVEDAVNDNSSWVALSMAKMTELGLSRGDTVLLEGKEKESVCLVTDDSPNVTDDQIRMNRVVSIILIVNCGL